VCQSLQQRLTFQKTRWLGTVKEANEMAESGIDTEFSKGNNTYDQFYGVQD
jgi:hypothetical protein